MLVATFAPTTAWAGRTITYYDGSFTLEGHGFVTAHDVLEYDRQGHLVWAYDGLREWACSLAPPPAMVAPAAYLPSTAPGRTPPTRTQPAPATPLQHAPAQAAAQALPQAAGGAAAATVAPAAQSATPVMVQDLWRARCLDFDVRVLTALAGSGGPGAEVLAAAARCIRWDFPAAAEGRRRAFSLYDRDGTPIHTSWEGPETLLREEGDAAAAPPPDWLWLDAPWASMAAPPGWMGGAPEAAGPVAAAAMQARGADWTAWAADWFTPMTTMYASSHGQLAALLFAVDLGAGSLDDAAYSILVRQELDAAHRDVTLEWRTDDLARRLRETGLVESVAYGTLSGRPASRIVAESRAGFPHGPRGIHIVQYVFMSPPYTCSLDFTVPSAASQRLGEADRCAATFVFKG